MGLYRASCGICDHFSALDDMRIGLLKCDRGKDEVLCVPERLLAVRGEQGRSSPVIHHAPAPQLTRCPSQREDLAALMVDPAEVGSPQK